MVDICNHLTNHRSHYYIYNIILIASVIITATMTLVVLCIAQYKYYHCHCRYKFIRKLYIFKSLFQLYL